MPYEAVNLIQKKNPEKEKKFTISYLICTTESISKLTRGAHLSWLWSVEEEGFAKKVGLSSPAIMTTVLGSISIGVNVGITDMSGFGS